MNAVTSSLETILQSRLLFEFLAGFAGLVTAYTASEIIFDPESQRDCLVVRFGRRVAHPLLSASLFWCVVYSEQTQWQPWPPFTLVIGAIAMTYFFRALALYFRRREMEREAKELMGLTFPVAK